MARTRAPVERRRLRPVPLRERVVEERVVVAPAPAPVQAPVVAAPVYTGPSVGTVLAWIAVAIGVLFLLSMLTSMRPIVGSGNSTTVFGCNESNSGLRPKGPGWAPYWNPNKSICDWGRSKSYR